MVKLPERDAADVIVGPAESPPLLAAWGGVTFASYTLLSGSRPFMPVLRPWAIVPRPWAIPPELPLALCDSLPSALHSTAWPESSTGTADAATLRGSDGMLLREASSEAGNCWSWVGRGTRGLKFASDVSVVTRTGKGAKHCVATSSCAINETPQHGPEIQGSGSMFYKTNRT